MRFRVNTTDDDAGGFRFKGESVVPRLLFHPKLVGEPVLVAYRAGGGAATGAVAANAHPALFRQGHEVVPWGIVGSRRARRSVAVHIRFCAPQF